MPCSLHARSVKRLEATAEDIIATIHASQDSPVALSPAILSRFTVMMVDEYSSSSKEQVVLKLMQDAQQCPYTSGLGIDVQTGCTKAIVDANQCLKKADQPLIDIKRMRQCGCV